MSFTQLTHMIPTSLQTTALMSSPAPPSEPATPCLVSAARGTFWSRHQTIINFWLDVSLLILFVVQGWMFAVLHVVFPRGAGSDWKIWGATPLDWSESLFGVFCVFSIAIVLHVMLHWNWICAVITTRLLGRKASKDDGSQTLIGVGVLVALGHLLAAGILAAKVGLVAPG